MKIVMGVTFCIMGAVGLIVWLAYSEYGDLPTIAVAIFPVVIMGVGAFFIADGIAEENGLPPYGKKPA